MGNHQVCEVEPAVNRTDGCRPAKNSINMTSTTLDGCRHLPGIFWDSKMVDCVVLFMRDR